MREREKETVREREKETVRERKRGRRKIEKYSFISILDWIHDVNDSKRVNDDERTDGEREREREKGEKEEREK